MKIENIHDKKPARLIYKMEDDGGMPSSLSITKDGQIALVTLTFNGADHIQIIDINSKKLLYKSERIYNILYSCFSPDEKYILAGSNKILIWNNNGKVVCDWSRYYGSGLFTINPIKKEIAAILNGGNIFL